MRINKAFLKTRIFIMLIFGFLFFLKKTNTLHPVLDDFTD